MPLPGGASEKYGNRFEGKWTAYCLARVMAEEADSIRIEPPGFEGDGCEFFVQNGALLEYHQVKRQHALPGAWSLSELARNGVLKNAFEKSNKPENVFVFVSAISAGALSEIADASQKAANLSEFKNEFLKGTKSEAWDQLLGEWRLLIEQKMKASIRASPSEREVIAFDHLRNIHVRTIDEESLAEMVDIKLRTLICGAQERVRNDLCAIALESIHKTLFADSIWTHLANLGHRRMDYSKDLSVLASVNDLNRRYETMIKPIADGISIPREETEKAFRILTGDESKRSVLVSGEAGVGKTVILGQVIGKVRTAEIPHLYFRVDRLEPTELPQNVGSQLGLPAGPVEVLGGVAKGRVCVLIVDQMDAVSLVSGRNPEFFACIHEIIRQAEAFPNMRLLLACRRFDLEKDNRLRELTSEHGPAQEINTKPFSITDVKIVLEKLGCKPSDFSDRQLELLRLPLHLCVFAQIANQNKNAAVSFTSAVDLFNSYWDQKRRAVSKRLGSQPDQWLAVLDRLCDSMTQRQTLFVPENEVLDDYERIVRAMESENILVLDGHRIGFFHEGFFDYVFARRFTAKRKDLIEYVKSGEQYLFKRAPLRQILLHAHAIDHKDFVVQLRRVINDPTIRFHLKKCAMESATKINHSSTELWQLLEELLSGGNGALAREASRVLYASPSWFPFLHGKGLLRKWLVSSDTEHNNRAMLMIQNHIQLYPGESVELLEPYVGASAEWNARILNAIWHRVLSTDRRVFDLFLRMVEIDAVVVGGHLDFWTCIYDLPKNRPAWAAEAVGSYFGRVLKKIRMEDIQWHFLPHDGTGERLLPEIAVNAPQAFVENVLPFFLAVVTGIAQERDGKLQLDRVWSMRMYREEPMHLEDAVLLGLETALRTLAEKLPKEFKKYVDQLIPYGKHDSANFLLVRSLAVAPREFANISVDYLVDNPQRLECGWAAAGGGDFSYWAARELVEHASKSCSPERFSRLEQIMLAYFPLWERSKHGYKQRGHWHMVMLPALTSDRADPLVKARIDELKRKFPKFKIRAPIPSKVHMVGSPIESKAAKRMTDEQWLRAIERYNTEDGLRRLPGRFLEGGAHQLSDVLEMATKRDPERFARLSAQFPADAHAYYFHAVLRGLKDVGANKEMVFDVVRRLHGLPAKPGGHYVVGAITKFGKEDIPDDILGIVGWLATEADDPKTDETTIKHIKGTEEDRPYDILATAINSVRGVAAEGVGTLLFDRGERAPFFLPYLERMVHDPSVIARTTVAYALLGLYRHDERRAVDLFLALCDCKQDVLFATRHVDCFLQYGVFRHFKRLRPVIRRMLDSRMAIVRNAGACHACLAQFSNPDAKDMVDECLAGDDAKRKGAASVAQANVFQKNCREFSHSTLKMFFDDLAKDVRDEASQCFFNTEGRQLESCRELIRVFVNSKAFVENIEDLMIPLEHSTADLAEEITQICEAVIRTIQQEGTDSSRRSFGQAEKVAKLLLRAYKLSTDDGYRSRCLDLVDQLLSMESYGITNELEAFER